MAEENKKTGTAGESVNGADKEKDKAPEKQPEQETAKKTEADAAAAEKDKKDAAEGQAEEKNNKAAESREPDKKDGASEKKPDKDPRDQKIADLTDRVQRTLAEFDNFRKRTEKEKALMYDVGAKEVIEKILPVLDNFERGLAAVGDDKKEDPFVQGMDKVYRQFTKALDDIGVKPIEAKGKAFDPDFHNAVMHVEDESVGENIVVEEFQKGYTYHDSVVRHSMVKVAN